MNEEIRKALEEYYEQLHTQYVDKDGQIDYAAISGHLEGLLNIAVAHDGGMDYILEDILKLGVYEL